MTQAEVAVLRSKFYNRGREAELLAVLGINPQTVTNPREARDAIYKRLCAECRLAYVTDKGLKVGDRVGNGQVQGKVLRIRPDGYVQVQTDGGRSSGLNPRYLKKLVG